MSVQPSHTDLLMAQAFHSGEEQGLAYLYEAFLPALSHFALQYTNDSSIAEEIASEAFVKTWKMQQKRISFRVIPQVSNRYKSG